MIQVYLKPKKEELSQFIGVKDAPYIITIDGVAVAGVESYGEVEAFSAALHAGRWYCLTEATSITVYHSYKGLKGYKQAITPIECREVMKALELGIKVWGVEVDDYEDGVGSPFINYLIGVDAKNAFDRFISTPSYRLYELTLAR